MEKVNCMQCGKDCMGTQRCSVCVAEMLEKKDNEILKLKKKRKS